MPHQGRNMPAEHFDWSLTGWFAAMGTAVLGYAARGMRLATQWGRMEAQVRENRADLHRLEGMFQTHLKADEVAQRELQRTLAGISRDLNQLIGRTQAGRGEG